jgi:hypothetical protein
MYDGAMTNTTTTASTADTTGPTIPTGVTIVTDRTATDVWGTPHMPGDIDPAAMVVVSATWGTNATVDITDPSRGVGRGYVRPFIANGDGTNRTDDDGNMTCRVCRDTMPVNRFPTYSKPRSDGRTRDDRCRACRDAATAARRTPAPVTVDRPRANAGRDAWVAYATAVGITITDDMGRNDIRSACAA